MSDSFELVILFMSLTAIALLAGETERNSGRSVAMAGLLIIGIAFFAGLALVSRPIIGTELASHMALLALLIAAPLIDRTRTISLLVAAPALALALFHYAVPYITEQWHMNYNYVMMLISASIIGLFGSAMLPVHRPREYHIHQALIGRAALAMTLGLILWGDGFFVKSALLCAWIAGAIAYFKGMSQPLRYVGMGLVAGTILAQTKDMPTAQMVLAACAGAYFTFAGEKTSKALVIDDPHNITGMVLMPALFGVLLTGLSNHMLAESLQWLGVAVAVGIIASLGWLIVKFTLGLSAPQRLLREGLDATLAP